MYAAAQRPDSCRHAFVEPCVAMAADRQLLRAAVSTIRCGGSTRRGFTARPATEECAGCEPLHLSLPVQFGSSCRCGALVAEVRNDRTAYSIEMGRRVHTREHLNISQASGTRSAHITDALLVERSRHGRTLPSRPTITAFERSADGGTGLARDMRVNWALEEVDQPYTCRVASFDALKGSAHRVMNPFGQLPTYEKGTPALFESRAIVFHIARTSCWPAF